jgi:hypothetical protein
MELGAVSKVTFKFNHGVHREGTEYTKILILIIYRLRSGCLLAELCGLNNS